MPTAQAAGDLRKHRGAWYTPPELADLLADHLLDDLPAAWRDRPLRVLDPACGDGRLLVAVGRRLSELGLAAELVGCDVDPAALAAVTDAAVTTIHANALDRDWGSEQFDVVVGNPPFLSQMSALTTRRGASRHGGGPYADAAAEFLALSVRLARPDGGRVGLVLPQSILGARDAGPVRDAVDRQAQLVWSWWEPRQRHFDASVNVCLLGFRRPATTGNPPWSAVVTERLGIPAFDRRRLRTNGTLGDRALLNANFRDEYYALVPAVGDEMRGPPLVTSGLIDPGCCRWGEIPVTFARRVHQAPRVDVSALSERFQRWASRKLVPKVMVANQTRIVEAVADPEGAWLPGVPVNTATPRVEHAERVWEIAAVLTSPVASASIWQDAGGTGLSTTSVRVGPASLAAIAWPGGDLTRAIAALRAGRLLDCAAAVCDAYGLAAEPADRLVSWWAALLPAGVGSGS